MTYLRCWHTARQQLDQVPRLDDDIRVPRLRHGRRPVIGTLVSKNSEVRACAWKETQPKALGDAHAAAVTVRSATDTPAPAADSDNSVPPFVMAPQTRPGCWRGMRVACVLSPTLCVPVRTLRVVLTVMLPSTRLSSQPTPNSLSERVTAGHTSRRYFSAGQASGQVRAVVLEGSGVWAAAMEQAGQPQPRHKDRHTTPCPCPSPAGSCAACCMRPRLYCCSLTHPCTWGRGLQRSSPPAGQWGCPPW